MSGLVYEINDREFARIVGEIADRVEHQQRALKVIGAIGRESVRSNFGAGGRPQKWPDIKNRSGQPLRDTGRLQNSIGAEVKGDTVYIGTNVVYAPVHHFGAKKGSFGTTVAKVKEHTRIRGGKSITVRAHNRKMKLPWGDIPARPFLLLQDDDVVEIKAILVDWIMEGKL